MNFADIFKLFPTLISLATTLFTKRKTPPRRVEDVLGPPSADLETDKVLDAARQAGRDKFGN